MANQTIEIGFCALCGRALLQPEGICTLSDGNLICSKCIRRLRVMLPLTVSSDSSGKMLRNDTMQKLSLAEAEQKIMESPERLKIHSTALIEFKIIRGFLYDYSGNLT